MLVLVPFPHQTHFFFYLASTPFTCHSLFYPLFLPPCPLSTPCFPSIHYSIHCLTSAIHYSVLFYSIPFILLYSILFLTSAIHYPITCLSLHAPLSTPCFPSMPPFPPHAQTFFSPAHLLPMPFTILALASPSMPVHLNKTIPNYFTSIFSSAN